jgi:hypothetical protein
MIEGQNIGQGAGIGSLAIKEYNLPPGTVVMIGNKRYVLQHDTRVRPEDNYALDLGAIAKRNPITEAQDRLNKQAWLERDRANPLSPNYEPRFEGGNGQSPEHFKPQ